MCLESHGSPDGFFIIFENCKKCYPSCVYVFLKILKMAVSWGERKGRDKAIRKYYYTYVYIILFWTMHSFEQCYTADILLPFYSCKLQHSDLFFLVILV